MQRPPPYRARMHRLLASVRRATARGGARGLVTAARHLYSQYTPAARSPAAQAAARGWARVGLLSPATHTGGEFSASARQVLVAWRWHGLLQRLYFPAWFRALLRLLDRLPFFRLQLVLALGYRFPTGRRYPRLDGAFAYRHPVTGAPCADSIADLRGRALGYAGELLEAVEGRLSTGGVMPRGPSLESGVTGSEQQMRHFMVRNVEELLRMPLPNATPNVAVY